MLKCLTFILSFLIVTSAWGQDSLKQFSYHGGASINYAGLMTPRLTLPFGLGLNVSATFEKFSKVKPTIEASAVCFPGYVRSSENSAFKDGARFAYGVYNLLVGAKYKVSNSAKVSLSAGPSVSSIEEGLNIGLKPSFELNRKNDKVAVQLYYLAIMNSQLLRGYSGIAVLFKIR